MALKGRHSTSQERLRAVRLLKDGNSADLVAKMFDVSRAALFKWQQKYDLDGPVGLQAKKTPGPPSRLTPTQVSQLYAIITGCDPSHLQFDSRLWTRSIIRDLVRQEFGMEFSEVGVGRLLARMGLRGQRPLAAGGARDPRRAADPKSLIYPRIRSLALAEGASVFFEHEARITSERHAGAVRESPGLPPVIVAAGERKPVNMVSAISPRGKLRFRVLDGSMNAEKFIDFLSALLGDVQGDIFLIADGNPSHRAKKVSEFVRGETGMRMRIFFPQSTNP